MKKYYALRNKDGELLPYFPDGALSALPIVYVDTKPVKKSCQFDAKIEEVLPTHAILDENGKEFIHFLSQEVFDKVLPTLTLLPEYKAVKL